MIGGLILKYSAGTVSTLFWLNETRKTAELMLDGLDKDQIKELVIKDNLYQVTAEDRAKRIYGVALKRINAMPDNLIQLMKSADVTTVKLLVLISIMKTDLLFFEFVHEVHRQGLILGERRITDKSVNAFFDAKASQSDIVAGWSESGIKKLKQCYIKMLFEAGLLSDVSSERRIIKPPVDYKLRQLLDENNLTKYLNAVTGDA